MEDTRELLAERVAEAATGCAGVAGLTVGRFGTAATYLPGRTVRGVVVRADAVEVHLVARVGIALPEVAANVRAAVAHLAPDHAIDVVIDDLVAAEPAP